jgi:hypothetical protein
VSPTPCTPSFRAQLVHDDGVGLLEILDASRRQIPRAAHRGGGLDADDHDSFFGAVRPLPPAEVRDTFQPPPHRARQECDSATRQEIRHRIRDASPFDFTQMSAPLWLIKSDVAVLKPTNNPSCTPPARR